MFKRIVSNIRKHSDATLRAWCYQCESIFAQRPRRLGLLFSLSQFLNGSQVVLFLTKSLPKCFRSPLRSLMMLSLANAAEEAKLGGKFNWTEERLSLDNFKQCLGDVDFIETLNENKLCQKCKVKNMKYCFCRKQKDIKNLTNAFIKDRAVQGKAMIDSAEGNTWEPYFSDDDFLIWKREEKSNMYSYKVYVRFDDISAEDLLHVQTDLKYRKKWDDTVVRLEVIEKDPLPNTNSQLIYWEMKWPKWFHNRDYVYSRRSYWDHNRKVIYVGSRGTHHHKYPKYEGKVRVTDYWSLMVIKPYRNFHEPGVHYILVYFDNPGLLVPKNLKAWMTQRKMPEFLKKMHKATKQYSQRHKPITQINTFEGFALRENIFPL